MNYKIISKFNKQKENIDIIEGEIEETQKNDNNKKDV